VLAYNWLCIHIDPSTDELALYSTIYCRFVYHEGRVYGHDGGYEEAIWLQGFLDDLEIEHDLLKLNCDSMSAIYMGKNQVYHARTKHIDFRFHFVREILDEGDIELKKIHMKENPIDMLIKVVSRVKFIHCKELLHILLVV